MPRTARLDAPGAAHHVLLRGVARADVFRDDRDRFEFRTRLERLLREEEFHCMGWALMPNHVHLLLQTGPNPLSRLMARLATGYAQHFNRRHDRVGHLFQNRFKSLPVDSQRYAMSLVRYVHRNPLESGLVANLEALERHPWTGLPELLGHPLGHPEAAIVDVDRVLGWFGPSPAYARSALRVFLAGDDEGLDESPIENPFDGERDPDRWEALFGSVCVEQQVARDEILAGRRSRRVADARALLAFRARTELRMTFVEIERRLRLGAGTASRAFDRGRTLRRP